MAAFALKKTVSKITRSWLQMHVLRHRKAAKIAFFTRKIYLQFVLVSWLITLPRLLQTQMDIMTWLISSNYKTWKNPKFSISLRRQAQRYQSKAAKESARLLEMQEELQDQVEILDCKCSHRPRRHTSEQRECCLQEGWTWWTGLF